MKILSNKYIMTPGKKLLLVEQGHYYKGKMDPFVQYRISYGSKTEILTKETTNKIYKYINTLPCKGSSLVPMSKYKELI